MGRIEELELELQKLKEEEKKKSIEKYQHLVCGAGSTKKPERSLFASDGSLKKKSQNAHSHHGKLCPMKK